MWGIELDRQSELQLKRQIYQSMRELIQNGQLKAGEQLPSTREFANKLEVSRNTVSEAYEMLLAEGFIVSRQGAPTRVADGIFVEKAVYCPANEKGSSTSTVSSISPVRTYAADFHTGRPDLRQFPRFLWQQLLRKAAEEMPLEQLDYSGPQGLPELREEIAAWLFRSRGINVIPQDIFITAGATHALSLIADLLCTDGGAVLMEDPCHSGMLRTFKNKGCPIIPIPVDEQGMQTQYLRDDSGACAVYVTPSHQFPLGGILPASRRAVLIRYARDNDIYIIEDDYDSEFRYCGEPIAPLYSMDTQIVINEILDLLGLTERRHHLPSQLSGGQQQRVAIGRALITKPKLILADEPTGNLDSKNSQDVIDLLTQASRHYQQTILMITHNKNLTDSVDRVFRVTDGVLTDLGGKTDEALS